MPASRLTGRTLALATVALVLACAKAVVGEPPRISRPGIGRATAAPQTPSGGGRVPISPRPRQAGGRVTAFTQGGGQSSISTMRGEGRSMVISRAGERRVVTSPPPAAQRPATQAAATAPQPRSRVQEQAAAAQPAQPARPMRRIVIGESARSTKAATADWAVAARQRARHEPRVLDALQTAPPPPALSKNAFSLSGGASSGAVPPP